MTESQYHICLRQNETFGQNLENNVNLFQKSAMCILKFYVSKISISLSMKPTVRKSEKIFERHYSEVCTNDNIATVTDGVLVSHIAIDTNNSKFG